MKPLSPSDDVALQAAQEWLKKGQHAEAAAEIQKVSAEQQHHPDVLEARWEAYAQAGNWAAALEVSLTIRQHLPEAEVGWLYQACSLDELNRLPEAFDVLVSAFEKFPAVPAIPYNLACCTCRLGRLKEASSWLAQAAKVGGRAEVKLMALGDDDLAPLLDEICAM
ncbi:MAG: tetratricopeptide repeat protein [Verrucomicrobia bacterium]|nr:tetratricopeptide repeat protein [Verrucomicrobiota bacterium]